MIKGISASRGIAIGKAFRLEEVQFTIEKKSVSNTDQEIKRLEQAIEDAKKDLTLIRDQTLKSMGQDKANIFEAHLLVAADPELFGQVTHQIKNEQVNAEFALKEIRDNFITIFQNLDNEYMRERASDIKDVTDRILGKLLGVKANDPSLIKEEVILIAHDLTPSDTAQINKQYVKGFITDIGGRTSHSAIMARSLEVPAIVGTQTIMKEAKEGMMMILDAIEGIVILNPTEDEIASYEKKRDSDQVEQVKLAKLKDQPTVSADGVHVELAANIGSPKDIEGVLHHGAEAIGLFRTEFLYMGRDNFPTEDEQYEAYKEVLERMQGKPVVIRTLDIGGDKKLPYLEMPKEMNPFLGYRAIRLCLDRKEIFRTQLRALLRASIHGNLRIMFPLIATIDEFTEAKAFLEEIKDELHKEGKQVSEQIQVGMMVEIPAAALLADQFAKVVDFFSIGTNDLIQYTFAADRMNEHVSYLYQPYNPSLLRLIKQVIDAAHKEGKWAGMCGEMAGDPIAVPLLLGLGLDEFSMSATSILRTRKLLGSLSQKEAQTLAEEALQQRTNQEVVNLVNRRMNL